jgi:phosphate starvation-inducible membrane PsiE
MKEQLEQQSAGKLIGHFCCILFTFVGIGLVASSIIKYPTDPAKFAFLAIVGLVLFFVSSACEEMAISSQKIRYHGIWKKILGAFLFSAGIGMISASIQDFEHIPHRMVVTLPLAIFSACIGFLLRKWDENHPYNIGKVLLFGVLVALGSWGVIYAFIKF